MKMKEFLIGMLFGALIFALAIFVVKSNERPVLAQTAESGNIVAAVTGTIESNNMVLWLIFPTEKRLLVYELGTSFRQARLVAARDIKYDIQLDDYFSRSAGGRNMNWFPTVAELKKLIEEQKKEEKK